MKNVHTRSFSGPYIPVFGLNTERCGVSFRIQSECGKTRTRKSPNTDTSHSKANCDTYVVLLSKDSWKLSIIKTSWTSSELCICVQFTSLVYGLCSYFCTEFEVYSFILAEFRMRGGTFLFSMQNWDPKGPRRIEPKCIPPK